MSKNQEVNIIIEASQINSFGGIVLLELLLKYIAIKPMMAIVYISYDKVYDRLKKYKSVNITIVKTTLIATLLRYMYHRKNVLFFCNLPPLVRCEHSILYIHNLFFVNKPMWETRNSSLGLNLRKYLYYLWIKSSIHKVSLIGCQTREMRVLLKRNFQHESLELPFFDEIRYKMCNVEKLFDFFYPSSSGAHKNIERLLSAIEKVNMYKRITVALTIGKGNEKILERIKVINQKYGNGTIVNLGLITHEDVLFFLLKSHALIFPSLKESLGLPLIESLQLNIPILSADLPYTHDVVINPIVFNPYSSEDIAAKMLDFVNGKLDSKKQALKIHNRLECLLGYFVKNRM